MPRLLRSAGAIGLAAVAYRGWQRLSAEQRRQLVAQARRHGPKLAKAGARIARARLKSR